MQLVKWFLELSPPQGEPLIILFWELPRGDASRTDALSGRPEADYMPDGADVPVFFYVEGTRVMSTRACKSSSWRTLMQ